MSDLMVVNDQRDTRLALSNVEELTSLAARFYKFPPRGIALSKEDAAALAAMSWMLDADPYNDELYPTNKGIQKGIMLYRRKAQKYAREVNDSKYSVRFRKPEEGEIQYDPTAGDMAIVCELVDEKEHVDWEQRWSKFFNMLYEASKDYKYADKRATQMAGPEPIHIGYGVVDGREKFSGDYYEGGKKTDKPAPEMMVREQRRNKRAEKAALKSAYPDLMARLDGNNKDFDLEKVVNVVIKEVELKQLEAPRHQQEGWTVDGALMDLGVDVVPAEQVTVEFRPDTPVPAEDPISDYDIASDSPEADENQATCKLGDAVVDMVLAANVGFKDRDKLIAALNKSEFLSPGMEDKWYKMWANFYAVARRKQLNQDASVERADNNVANVMDQEKNS